MASVAEKYDIDEVETNLNELERELDDEMKLENTLDSELDEQLQSVTKFTQLKEVVSNQKKRAIQLRNDIKKLVQSNDEKTEKNKELSAMLESEEFLQVKQDADGVYWACRTCSTDLGVTQHNFKDGCIREDSPVSACNPLIGDPADFIDDKVAFRQFYCPGCGAQIDNEIAVSSDPILCDISVAL